MTLQRESCIYNILLIFVAKKSRPSFQLSHSSDIMDIGALRTGSEAPTVLSTHCLCNKGFNDAKLHTVLVIIIGEVTVRQGPELVI